MHMPLLVRLNAIAIELRGRIFTSQLAEFDELLILFQRERLARKLSGADPLDGRVKAGEQLVHRSVSSGGGIEPAEVDAHSLEVFLNEPVVLGLVASLTGQREFYVDFRCRGKPDSRNLTGLELVFEGHFQTPDHLVATNRTDDGFLEQVQAGELFGNVIFKVLDERHAWNYTNAIVLSCAACRYRDGSFSGG